MTQINDWQRDQSSIYKITEQVTDKNEKTKLLNAIMYLAHPRLHLLSPLFHEVPKFSDR